MALLEKVNKNKRTLLSIKDRCDIIERLEAGELGSQLAEEYKVTKAAIFMIKRRKEDVLKAKSTLDECEGDMQKKRYRATEETPLDRKLFEWFKHQQNMGYSVSNSDLRNKALLYNQRLGSIVNFKASDGWVNGFKMRHGFKHQASPKEKKKKKKVTIDYDAGETFKQKIDNIMKTRDIGLDHIYCCDETGLYWKTMPIKKLVRKQKKKADGKKKPKNRLSVLMCTNASGTHQLPLFVVGKTAQPRCFKGIKNLPTYYVGQENAWMTSDLMESWYRTIFLPQVQKKHSLDTNKHIKIILLMDNMGHHPPAEMLNDMTDSCTVIYLPPNVASIIQPLNPDIIDKFKKCYRNILLERVLTEDEDDCSLSFFNKFNLLHCLKFCFLAWDQVTANDIRIGWRNLIPLDDNDSKSSMTIDSIDVQVLHSLWKRIHPQEELSTYDIEDWLNIDSHENGWPTHSDEDILSGNFDANKKNAVDEFNDEVSYEDQESTPSDTISNGDSTNGMEALHAANKLIYWYERNSEGFNTNLQVLLKIQNDLIKKKVSRNN